MSVRGFIKAQLILLLFATCVAVADIESIVFTGAVLSATSLGIAVGSFLAGRTLGFYFGLATPTVTVVCFSIICGLEWSPRDAQKPIASLLVVFCGLCFPLGILAARETRRSPAVRRRRRFQFGIATMLWAMVVGAILCGPVATLNPQWIAISVLAAYFIVAGKFARRFHVDKASRKAEDGGEDAEESGTGETIS